MNAKRLEEVTWPLASDLVQCVLDQVAPADPDDAHLGVSCREAGIFRSREAKRVLFPYSRGTEWIDVRRWRLGRDGRRAFGYVAGVGQGGRQRSTAIKAPMDVVVAIIVRFPSQAIILYLSIPGKQSWEHLEAALP